MSINLCLTRSYLIDRVTTHIFWSGFSRFLVLQLLDYLSFIYVCAALTDDGKFLLAACKLKHTTCTDYIISLRADDMSRRSQAYVGKVRCVYMIKQDLILKFWHIGNFNLFEIEIVWESTKKD